MPLFSKLIFLINTPQPTKYGEWKALDIWNGALGRHDEQFDVFNVSPFSNNNLEYIPYEFFAITIIVPAMFFICDGI